MLAFAPQPASRATTGSVIAMSAVMFVAGAAIAPAYTSIYAMVDGAAPTGTVTEAFAWLESAVCIGSAVGAAGAGIVAQHAGAPSVLILAGLAGAASIVVAALGARTLTNRVHQVAQPRLTVAESDDAVVSTAAA
jgi:predicted MFS family arabinose efflux permease